MVVSGGDVANVPWKNLESFLMRLLGIQTIRDIRLATKALVGLPQHWLQPEVVEGLERVARTAARRGVNLAIHTHVNHVNSLTPLVARAAHTALEVGVRDVRNQGVLMRGVNATSADLLDLCFGLQGEAGILPYYFYMCDMIPNAEHWRVAVWQAQALQHDIMGYLPGYATPRIVCDVPFVGNSTPTVDKLKLTLRPVDRYDAMITYLQAHPGVRDVVVSGGDVAKAPSVLLGARSGSGSTGLTTRRGRRPARRARRP